MKTKLSAGVAPTCLKNAQFAKSGCPVPKSKYLSNIDHLVHKVNYTVSLTRINQFENLKTKKNGHLSSFNVHLVLYPIIFKFSIFTRDKG